MLGVCVYRNRRRRRRGRIRRRRRLTLRGTSTAQQCQRRIACRGKVGRKEATQEKRAHTLQGKTGETFKKEGVEKEDENRKIALRFIQNEAVDGLGKGSVIGVLGDGNQRSGC